jgi:SAM-dependent methyltransferase
MADEEWSRTIEAALAANPDLETWAGHFRHRIGELEEVRKFWPRRTVKSALEIGCGNGLAAIYFSPLAGKIVATDLESIDSQAHSIGLGFARRFVEKVGVKNVELLGCSAEKVPLPDASFDLAYGIYCLEHIPDRAAALVEMRRVLRAEGQVLFTVPGTAWALLNPFPFYSYLLRRGLGRIRRRFWPKKAEVLSASESAALVSEKVTDASSFLRHYPHFPMPEPHGTFSSWPAELWYYRASNWKRVMEAAGFRNVSVEPITFVPYLLQPLLPKFLQRGVDRICRAAGFLKPLAQFYCLLGEAPPK